MKPRVLLVEGPDDRGVCIAFLRRLALGDEIAVEAKSGYQELRKGLPLELLVAGRTHVGVVVDADDDLAARWRSLKDAVEPYGYRLPDLPPADGAIIECDNADRPRLGVWLMPDNGVPGMLEDFIRVLVPAEDFLMARAEAVVADIPAHARLFSPAHVRKAEIHTWLAWQSEPGRPMGQAITKKFLDGDGDGAKIFADWIQRLFGP